MRIALTRYHQWTVSFLLIEQVQSAAEQQVI